MKKWICCRCVTLMSVLLFGELFISVLFSVFIVSLSLKDSILT